MAADDYPKLRKLSAAIVKGGASSSSFGPLGKNVTLRAEIKSVEPEGRFTVSIEGQGKTEDEAIQQFHRKLGELNRVLAGIIEKRT